MNTHDPPLPAADCRHDDIAGLLRQVADGEVAVAAALQRLRHLPYQDLDWAKIDHHRALRTGLAEVVFCAGKQPDQVAQIFAGLAATSARVLGTRASAAQHEAVRALLPQVRYHAAARCLTWQQESAQELRAGVLIVSAGTSDQAVVEEALVSLEMMGQRAARLTDVGVAGLHRLLAHLDQLEQARVIIVVAGMEGALPGVVAGLVSCPVVAVPTSVGYGASLGGVAALLGMLNSCAPGVSVVNIDNGFGAAAVAALINRGYDRAHAS